MWLKKRLPKEWRANTGQPWNFHWQIFSSLTKPRVNHANHTSRPDLSECFEKEKHCKSCFVITVILCYGPVQPVYIYIYIHTHMYVHIVVCKSKFVCIYIYSNQQPSSSLGSSCSNPCKDLRAYASPRNESCKENLKQSWEHK